MNSKKRGSHRHRKRDHRRHRRRPKISALDDAAAISDALVKSGEAWLASLGDVIKKRNRSSNDETGGDEAPSLDKNTIYEFVEPAHMYMDQGLGILEGVKDKLTMAVGNAKLSTVQEADETPLTVEKPNDDQPNSSSPSRQQHVPHCPSLDRNTIFEFIKPAQRCLDQGLGILEGVKDKLTMAVGDAKSSTGQEADETLLTVKKPNHDDQPDTSSPSRQQHVPRCPSLDNTIVEFIKPAQRCLDQCHGILEGAKDKLTMAVGDAKLSTGKEANKILLTVERQNHDDQPNTSSPSRQQHVPQCPSLDKNTIIECIKPAQRCLEQCHGILEGVKDKLTMAVGDAKLSSVQEADETILTVEKPNDDQPNSSSPLRQQHVPRCPSLDKNTIDEFIKLAQRCLDQCHGILEGVKDKLTMVVGDAKLSTGQEADETILTVEKQNHDDQPNSSSPSRQQYVPHCPSLDKNTIFFEFIKPAQRCLDQCHGILEGVKDKLKMGGGELPKMNQQVQNDKLNSHSPSLQQQPLNQSDYDRDTTCGFLEPAQSCLDRAFSVELAAAGGVKDEMNKNKELPTPLKKPPFGAHGSKLGTIWEGSVFDNEVDEVDVWLRTLKMQADKCLSSNGTVRKVMEMKELPAEESFQSMDEHKDNPNAGALVLVPPSFDTALCWKIAKGMATASPMDKAGIELFPPLRTKKMSSQPTQLRQTHLCSLPPALYDGPLMFSYFKNLNSVMHNENASVEEELFDSWVKLAIFAQRYVQDTINGKTSSEDDDSHGDEQRTLSLAGESF